MRNISHVLIFLMLALFPGISHADIFGGDVAVLGQILVQSIQQLAQLKSILASGEDSLQLLRDVNRGINDSLDLIKTVSPSTDPGLYSKWQKVDQVLSGLQNIYGVAVPSKDEALQKDADQNSADAFAMNTATYKYADQIDTIGEQIKVFSHQVSPGGAQKLSAETLGVMLHVMNQGLRTQGAALKISAQTLALQNHREKDATKATLQQTKALETSMAEQSATYALPRF